MNVYLHKRSCPRANLLPSVSAYGRSGLDVATLLGVALQNKRSGDQVLSFERKELFLQIPVPLLRVLLSN